MNNSQKGRICEIQKNTYYISVGDCSPTEINSSGGSQARQAEEGKAFSHAATRTPEAFLNISAGQEIIGKLKGSFDMSELPVVGDYVEFAYNPLGESLISAIVDRRNVMKRADQSGHAIGYVKTMVEQAMVANFDYVFIVSSLNDDYNCNRITRYVSYALQAEAVPVVILTKMDMCSNPGRFIREVEAISDKVRVHAVSALLGIGMEELATYFEPGNTIVLMGSSGAGKSTLVNAIAGKEIMKTGEIRESDSKGRHTTTYRHLLELENGVTFIDTPGMRELGMQNASDGIDDVFADIKELETRCRFNDCKHVTEPGCAVKKALETGELSEERYQLYLNLSNENYDNSQKMKQIAKNKKQLKKIRYE